MSQAKLFVGNLSFDATAEDLTELFSAFGSIEECKLIMDRETGRSRGFAFITFSDAESAEKAMNETNGTEHKGRTLRVNAADDNGRGGRR